MNTLSSLKTYLFAVVLGILLSSTACISVYAATPNSVLPTPPQVFQDINDIGNASSFTGDRNNVNRNLLNEGPKRILDLIFGTFATVGTIICIIAGIRIIFSNGDTKKFQQGIKAIVYAAIGIVIVGSAWMIVRAILSINPGN